MHFSMHFSSPGLQNSIYEAVVAPEMLEDIMRAKKPIHARLTIFANESLIILFGNGLSILIYNYMN